MKLIHTRATWGIDLPFEKQLDLIKADGYAAVEIAGGYPDDPAAAKDAFASRGLQYIMMAFTGGATVEEHLSSFKRDLQKLATFKPRHVTVHSGNDWFSFKEAVGFYKEVVKIERDLPIPIAHETHRGRIFFNPWITRDVLGEVPELKLCVDLSHWVCVTESLMPNLGPIIELVAKHCLHIHARVGYEEGPQVPDPSAPEYARHVETHEGWWKTMLAARTTAGHKETTITPEFGPPGYLHTLPHTNVPVADLRKVCNWMRDRVAKSLST
jgi:sugar phosphate isomerase/epimerase